MYMYMYLCSCVTISLFILINESFWIVIVTQWHLQKLRKLKEEMIIEAEKKLEEEKEREKQELEEKLRDKMTKKSAGAKKPLPSTPRAARINKLKKVSVSVSDKNSEDPKSEPAPDNDSVSDSKNSVSVDSVKNDDSTDKI